MSNMSTVLLVTWLMAVTPYVAHSAHAPVIYAHLIFSIYVIFDQFGGYISFWSYLAITCKVDLAVSFFFTYIWRNVGCIWPFSTLVVWVVFEMWQTYLFSDICQMCSVLLVAWLMAVTSYVAHIFAFILHICPTDICHIWPQQNSKSRTSKNKRSPKHTTPLYCYLQQELLWRKTFLWTIYHKMYCGEHFL